MSNLPGHFKQESSVISRPSRYVADACSARDTHTVVQQFDATAPKLKTTHSSTAQFGLRNKVFLCALSRVSGFACAWNDERWCAPVSLGMAGFSLSACLVSQSREGECCRKRFNVTMVLLHYLHTTSKHHIRTPLEWTLFVIFANYRLHSTGRDHWVHLTVQHRSGRSSG